MSSYLPNLSPSCNWKITQFHFLFSAPPGWGLGWGKQGTMGTNLRRQSLSGSCRCPRPGCCLHHPSPRPSQPTFSFLSVQIPKFSGHYQNIRCTPPSSLFLYNTDLWNSFLLVSLSHCLSLSASLTLAIYFVLTVPCDYFTFSLSKVLVFFASFLFFLCY